MKIPFFWQIFALRFSHPTILVFSAEKSKLSESCWFQKNQKNQSLKWLTNGKVDLTIYNNTPRKLRIYEFIFFGFYIKKISRLTIVNDIFIVITLFRHDFTSVYIFGNKKNP